MVIEWLKVRVDEKMRERYIQIDEEIWTTALAQYPGFLGKEIWLSPSHSDELIMVIQWATREQWKAIPEAELKVIEEQFDTALGTRDYKIIEAKEFVVRKFARRD